MSISGREPTGDSTEPIENGGSPDRIRLHSPYFREARRAGQASAACIGVVSPIRGEELYQEHFVPDIRRPFFHRLQFHITSTVKMATSIQSLDSFQKPTSYYSPSIRAKYHRIEDTSSPKVAPQEWADIGYHPNLAQYLTRSTKVIPAGRSINRVPHG